MKHTGGKLLVLAIFVILLPTFCFAVNRGQKQRQISKEKEKQPTQQFSLTQSFFFQEARRAFQETQGAFDELTDESQNEEEPDPSEEDTAELRAAAATDEELLKEAAAYAEKLKSQYTDEATQKGKEIDPQFYIPVLMYHHFVQDAYPAGDGAVLNISDFEDQLRVFVQAGYTPVFADELDTLLAQYDDDTGFGGKYLCITIDDGYRSNYDLAYPLLKEYAFAASISVVPSRIHTSYVTSKELPKLCWRDLDEMQYSGFVRIFNHTMNHVSETTVTATEFKKAVVDGETLLDQRLQQRFGRLLAYPNGDYNMATMSQARQMGYQVQLSTDFGVVSKNTSVMAIPRITVNSGMDGQDVLNRIFAAAGNTLENE